jgi:ATP-binding cassette subfamily C protein CydCD
VTEPSAPDTRGPIDPRIVGLSGAMRTHLVACGALAVVAAAAILVQAEALSRLLPRLVDGDASATGPLVAWLVAVAVVRAVATGLTERSSTRTLLATRRTVRSRVLDRLAHLRPDQRPHLGPARVGSLTGTALDALDPWVRSYLPGLMLAVVVPLAAGLRILGADLLSALILAVVVPLIPFFMVLIGRATEHHAADQWDALQRLAGRFLDVITGLPTLRLFGRAEAQVERVRVVTDRYRTATMRTLRIAFLSALVLEVLAALSVALIAVSLGIRLTQGSMELETALIVLLLAPECLLPIRRVGAAFHAATAGTDAAAEITTALELPVVASGTSAVPATGALEADAVSLDDPVRGARLATVSLRVEPGRLVAITGPSGAGKSTLLDILRGALTSSSGTVRLGGTEVAALSLADRAAAVRWCTQQPQAVGATVAASVALGHGTGAEVDAAVGAALEQLGISALAHADPAAISGGERRRVAVARALVGAHLGTARFVLLDEPTAQLDDVAARQVTSALRWAAERGAGVLVATHDPALADAADERLALTGGSAPSAPATDAEAAGDDAPASLAADLLPVARRDPEAPMPERFIAPRAAAEGAAPAPEVSGRDAVRWVLAAARPQRRRLIGAHALGVLTEICTVGLAATAAWLIVRAAEEPSFADLAMAAVAVRAFAIGKGVLRYTERLASHDATLRLLADLRATVVDRLTRLSPTGLPDGGRGELLTRLIDDIDRLQDLFLRVLGPLVTTLAVAIGACAAAGWIDPRAGLALLGSVLAAGVVLPLATHRAAVTDGTELADARGVVSTTTVDLAEHVDELVAWSAEPEWRDRIEQQAVAADAVDLRLARVTTVVAALGAALPALATAAVVAAAGAAGPSSGLTGPELGVLVLLPLAVLELLVPLSGAGTVLARVQASAVRVVSLLQRPDPLAEPDRPLPPPERADLDLRGVAVGWPHVPPQVDGIDLTVAAGRRIAVSGPSGSGKSTLAATLVAFLAPAAGEYRIGGERSGDLGGESVRRCVTWCQQEPWFADTTVADNLRVARPSATDDELRAALDVVHLTSWLARLPDGLDTRLERDATAISGGERQRLALARALLGGHGAVVLDEPTSHLDGPTAHQVLRDLLAATRDKAVVLIGHDLAATTGRADATVPDLPVHQLVPTADGRSRWEPAPGSVQG